MEITTSRLRVDGFSGEALGRAINAAIGTGKYAGFISRLDRVIVLIFNDDTSPEDINTALIIAEKADLSEKTPEELQDEADKAAVQAVLSGETTDVQDLVAAIRYLAK